MTFALYEWHERGECARWKALPQQITAQPRADVLWLLTRFRATLDEEPDFADLSQSLSTAADPSATKVTLLSMFFQGLLLAP